jgi:hypothetical protein
METDSAQNGSGVGDVTRQWFDPRGNLVWSQNELGRVTYNRYDPVSWSIDVI